jgi:hypothetical protein
MGIYVQYGSDQTAEAAPTPRYIAAGQSIGARRRAGEPDPLTEPYWIYVPVHVILSVDFCAFLWRNPRQHYFARSLSTK